MIVTALKVMWKYGVISICRLRRFINRLLDDFDKYETFNRTWTFHRESWTKLMKNHKTLIILTFGRTSNLCQTSCRGQMGNGATNCGWKKKNQVVQFWQKSAASTNHQFFFEKEREGSYRLHILCVLILFYVLFFMFQQKVRCMYKFIGI